MKRSHSVLPAASEQQWQTIYCDQHTALRIWVETGDSGYVRLQQLGFAQGMGWYVQKTFVIPGEALPLLVPQLRQARCVIPSRKEAVLGTPETLRLVPNEPETAQRRGA